MLYMHPLTSPSTPPDKFSALTLVQDVPDRDNFRHPPAPGEEERYQESWVLVWHDPLSRVSGFHHFGLQYGNRQADLWNTLSYKNEVFHNENSLTLPLPETDYDDMRIGGLRVVCEVPLMRQRIITGTADNGCDIVYDAFFKPCRWDMDVPGAASGKGHYENGGRVQGTARVNGETIQVNGYAYHDHSWGKRDYGKMLSFRNIFANFGPDFCVFVQDITTDVSGRTSMGYIYKDGVFHTLARVDSITGVADDGHSPVTYEATLWTNDGHGGLRLRGEAQAYNVSAHVNYFQSNAHMVWQCGDRLGVGYTVIKELTGPASWHREFLGLGPEV